jgi:hypothetical protein
MVDTYRMLLRGPLEARIDFLRELGVTTFSMLSDP